MCLGFFFGGGFRVLLLLLWGFCFVFNFVYCWYFLLLLFVFVLFVCFGVLKLCYKLDISRNMYG